MLPFFVRFEYLLFNIIMYLIVVMILYLSFDLYSVACYSLYRMFIKKAVIKKEMQTWDTSLLTLFSHREWLCHRRSSGNFAV